MTVKKEYKIIKLELLAKYQISPVDIYLNIGSKFVKIISKDSNVIMAELRHYISKDIEQVYISEEDFTEVIKEISNIIQNDQKVIQSKKIEITAISLNYIKLKLRNLNISEADITLLNNTTQSFIAELNLNKGPLKEKLAAFLNREDYTVNHSLITLYLTTILVQKLGWNSDETYNKINYASLFCDIALDAPFSTRIKRKTDPDFQQCSPEIQKSISSHQEKAVEILHSSGINLADIDYLILHHHELPDGSGYNKGMFPERLSLLSCAFNLVYYFSHEYLNMDINKTSFDSIKKDMDELFTKGNYKQPYKEFTKLIK